MKTEHPPDPAATTSASLVMMGVGVTFIPKLLGSRIFVHASGTAGTATAATAFSVGARFGKGSPPAGGAAVTGTKIAADMAMLAAGIAAGVGFCICDTLTLDPGINYWFDLCMSSVNSSNAASVKNVSITLLELPI
jgi:hypothetical protein